MPRLCLLCIGLVIAMLGTGATRPNEDVKDVIAAEKSWSSAVVRHDAKEVALILSDDFVGVDGRGVVSDKNGELAEARFVPPPTAMTLVSENLSDIRVRIYGGTAVLTAHNAALFDEAGKPRTINYRRTTVYVKRSGRWQCVSFHASRVLAEG